MLPPTPPTIWNINDLLADLAAQEWAQRPVTQTNLRDAIASINASPMGSVSGVTLIGGTDISVPAAAGSLQGPTLAANVLYSSLTHVGILNTPHVTALFVDSGGADITGASFVRGNFSVVGTPPVVFSMTDGTRTVNMIGTGGSGALPSGVAFNMTSAHGLSLATSSSLGQKLVGAYYDTGGAVYRSAWEVACTNGLAALALMTAGGTVSVGLTGAADFVIAGGGAALATAATVGFLYMSTCAGTPTGAPAGFTGTVPFVLDTTASKLWARIGGTWKGVVLA